MNYVNQEHKTTEALLVIKLVEECLSSGVANQFSPDALAGLSVSLKRARLLLNSNSDSEMSPIRLDTEEVVFDSSEDRDFAEQSFVSSNLSSQSRLGQAKESPISYMAQGDSKIDSSIPGLKSKIDVIKIDQQNSESMQRHQELRISNRRVIGQMGAEGPKITMNRKRLRAALDS